MALFSTPSQIGSRDQKVDQIAPLGRFVMDFGGFVVTFLASFFMFFQKPETLILVTLTVDLKVFSLPKHLLSASFFDYFGMLFRVKQDQLFRYFLVTQIEIDLGWPESSKSRNRPGSVSSFICDPQVQSPRFNIKHLLIHSVSTPLLSSC